MLELRDASVSDDGIDDCPPVDELAKYGAELRPKFAIDEIPLPRTNDGAVPPTDRIAAVTCQAVASGEFCASLAPQG